AAALVCSCPNHCNCAAPSWQSRLRSRDRGVVLRPNESLEPSRTRDQSALAGNCYLVFNLGGYFLSRCSVCAQLSSARLPPSRHNRISSLVDYLRVPDRYHVAPCHLRQPRLHTDGLFVSYSDSIRDWHLGDQLCRLLVCRRRRSPLERRREST